MKCKNCGKEIGDTKFCNYCGTKNESEVVSSDNSVSEKHFCKNCGTEIRGNFCAKCGTDNKVNINNNYTATVDSTSKGALLENTKYLVANKNKKLKIVGICAAAIIALIIIINAANPGHVTRKSKDLSNYIGTSESSLAKELNVEENTEGVYPSVEDDTFVCINGLVEVVSLYSGAKNDGQYNIYGIKLNDNITEAHNKLMDNFEPIYDDNFLVSFLELIINEVPGFENAEAYENNKTSNILLIGYDNNSKITNLILLSSNFMNYYYSSMADDILSYIFS